VGGPLAAPKFRSDAGKLSFCFRRLSQRRFRVYLSSFVEGYFRYFTREDDGLFGVFLLLE
jgi:hypothetical protein